MRIVLIVVIVYHLFRLFIVIVIETKLKKDYIRESKTEDNMFSDSILDSLVEYQQIIECSQPSLIIL
jgi:hypothetical protein